MKHETRCIKIKLKPGSIQKVREWARVLGERRDEALETMRGESVVLETVFLDRTSEGDFLIYVMKAESFEVAERAALESANAIDAFHQRFKRETWEEGKKLELLVDLENFHNELGSWID